MSNLTVGSNALAIRNDDDALNQEASVIERRADGVSIVSDEDFANAAKLLKDIKQMQKRVKDYWEPMRVNAKSAYDEVLSHKKEMLDPLEAAEKTIKSKMGAYSDEKNRIAREREAAMRKMAKQEMDRKIAEAANAEAEGDYAGAEFAMAEAEVMEDMSMNAGSHSVKVKVDGVSQSKTYEIVEVDSASVPVYFGGVEIRPVDLKAIMRIIKESKGTVQIPGIKYEEKTSISVRS